MRLAYTVEQIEAEADLCADRFSDRRVSQMLGTMATVLRSLGTGVVTGAPIQTEQWVTITQAADAAGVSRRVIYHAMGAGRVRSVREAGRHPKVSLDDVQALKPRGTR